MITMIEIVGAYNAAVCYTGELEEAAAGQIKTVCDQSAFADCKIRIMPDVHAGMGCTIGTTMTITDKIVPGMVGVDIDDWACDSCRDSMALSGVEIDVRCGSMDVVAGEKFDFVLANINRNILVGMMPSFAAALDVGGRLLMSGFLVEDVPVIESAAAEQGFVVERVSEREGWMVVECKKQ